MKTKARYHVEKTEILNKPGRFALIQQWTDGGSISHDTGPNSNGYTEDEADKEMVKRICQSKAATVRE